MGTSWVIGSDEAGFGTWAGNLFVAAVAVKADWKDPKVTDSKKLKKEARQAIVDRYSKDPSVVCILRVVEPSVIDRDGVWNALIQAHQLVHIDALSELANRGVYTVGDSLTRIVDGLENAHFPSYIKTMAKADLLVPAVSLASCFAKQAQVAHMAELQKLYPNFSFASHCGYGTAAHSKELATFGILPVHRKSYKPIQKYCPKEIVEDDDPLDDLSGLYE